MKQVSLYRHFNSENKLLYVGVSASAVYRLGQHAEHSDWFKAISRVSIEHFEDRKSALGAEREAIIREKPLHNIVHRKAAEEAQRQANEALSAAAQSKKDLTARIVYFKPVYSLTEAASALAVNMRRVRDMVRNDEIGHLIIPTKMGKPVQYISGWQLIDYIEDRLKRK